MTRAQGRLYLPFIRLLSVESDRRICKISGAYSVLNEQLSIILEKNVFSKKHFTFSSSFVKNSSQNLDHEIDYSLKKKILEWTPPNLPDYPNSFKDNKNPEEIINQLRYKKRGFAVSSFSKLSRRNMDGKKTLRIIKEFPSFEIPLECEYKKCKENDEVEFEIQQDSYILTSDSKIIKNKKLSQSKNKIQNDQLVGGIKTGNLLHDLLENINFSIINKSSSVEEWINFPNVRRFFESFNEYYENPSIMVPYLAELIWYTLRTPIKLGNRPDSPELELASIKKELREVDFYFPVPNKEKKSRKIVTKKQITNDGWNLEKFFLRGSIDFLFEHDNKIYLLDWKSNILENYNYDTLENEVLKNYELQVQIYTLATCYWFNIDNEEKFKERFGGVIYIFLRGMKRNTPFDKDIANKQKSLGVYFRLPSWQEFKSYEERIHSMDF